MKKSFARSVNYMVAAIILALVALGCAPLMSKASSPSASVTVVNSSNWVIHHIYTTAPDSNDWSGDQLNNASLNPGQSVTISPSCSGAQVKVITEDQNGCFLSQVVSCASSASWTIDNNATPDCGN